MRTKKYTQCIECGSKERKHQGHGLCCACYSKKRYHEDAVYREFHNKFMTKYYYDHREVRLKQMSEYNKKRRVLVAS